MSCHSSVYGKSGPLVELETRLGMKETSARSATRKESQATGFVRCCQQPGYDHGVASNDDVDAEEAG